jgi:hypothetical protein
MSERGTQGGLRQNVSAPLHIPPRSKGGLRQNVSAPLHIPPQETSWAR